MSFRLVLMQHCGHDAVDLHPPPCRMAATIRPRGARYDECEALSSVTFLSNGSMYNGYRLPRSGRAAPQNCVIDRCESGSDQTWNAVRYSEDQVSWLARERHADFPPLISK
jgi:hypothetical protein